jgi:hypothetical protein
MPQLFYGIFGLLYSAGVGVTAAFYITAGLVVGIVLGGLKAILKATGVLGGRKADDIGTRIRPSQAADLSRTYIYGTYRAGGDVLFFDTSGTDNDKLWMMVAFSSRECDALNKVYFNDEEISFNVSDQATTSPYSSVTCKRHVQFGTDSQAATAAFVSGVYNWTANHRNRGTATIGFELEFNRDVFPNGLPLLSAEWQGAKIYDPRLDSTVSGGSGSHRVADKTTWEYSANAALVLYDYMRDDLIGPAFPNSVFDMANIIAAANICDESVALAGGGTVARYTINGEVDGDERFGSVVSDMLEAMAGDITFTGDKFLIFPGEYATPTVSFDESNYSFFEMTPAPPRNQLVNGVKGIFVDATQDYQPVDYPAQTSTTALTQDNNERFWLDLDLVYVTNNATAQRIAKIEFERARLRRIIAMQTNLEGLRVKPNDTIYVSHANTGLVNEVFRVLTVDFEMNGEDGTAYTCNITAKEENSAAYSWTAGTDETVVTNPNAINLPPFPYGGNLQTPFGVVVLPDLVTSTGGAVQSGVNVSFSAPNSWVQATQVEVTDNASGDTVGAAVVPRGQTEVFIPTGAGTFDVALFNHGNFGEHSSTVNDTSNTVTDETEAHDTVNVSGVNSEGVAKTFGKVWRETFDSYTAISDVTDRYEDINSTASGAELSLETGGTAGNQFLRIGNNTGNDEYCLVHSGPSIPYNPNSTYRIGFRAKQPTGSGTVSMGVVGRNAADDDFIDSDGDTGGSFDPFDCFFRAGENVTLTTSFVDYEGYFSGTSATPLSQAADTPTGALELHTDCKYFRPYITVNETDQAGQVDIDEIWIEEMRPIETGDIADNNVTTPKFAIQAATELVSTFTATEISRSTVGPHDVQNVTIASGDNNGGVCYIVFTCSWGSNNTDNNFPLFEIIAYENGTEVRTVMTTNLNRMRSNPDAAHSAALTCIDDPTAGTTLKYACEVTLASGETATFEDRSIAVFQAKDNT